MNISKTMMSIMALGLLAGSFAVATDANAYNCPFRNGQMEHGNITDEQRMEAHEAISTTQDIIASMKQELFVQEQTLIALQNASEPDIERVSTVAGEIAQTRHAMQNERKALGDTLDTILGLAPGTHNFARHGLNGNHRNHREHRGGNVHRGHRNNNENSRQHNRGQHGNGNQRHMQNADM